MDIIITLRPIRQFLKDHLPQSVFLPINTVAVLLITSCNIYPHMTRIKNLKYSIRYKLFSYPWITNSFKRHFYPEQLFIILTTRCNIRCFICRRENFVGEDMKFENIYKLKKPIKYASLIDLTGWGECLLYPKFKEVINHIFSINRKKRIIQITSNGTLLSKDIANLLKNRLISFKISLNAATAETYNRDMKYGNFEKTIANIQDFMSGLDENDRKYISLHFVAHVDNYKEIPEFIHLAKKLNIEHVTIGNYLIGTTEHLDKGLFNVKNDYNSTVKEAQKIALELGIVLCARQFYCEKTTSSQNCTDPFVRIFISPSGEIASPCCFSGKYVLGNVYESSFDDVWFGKKYMMLRKTRHLPVCQHCTPFIAIDDLRAHFDGQFKQRPDFDSIIKELG